MLLNPFTYHTPSSIEEAAGLLENLDNVKIQAGGTFLLNSLKSSKSRGTKTPENIIGLNKVDDLKGIEKKKGSLILRAMTTIDELYTFDGLPENLSILKTVCKNISTQPIRNMATVGGNLTCRYTWTELPAVMIALEANLHFTDSKGNEEGIPAEEFFSKQAKTDKLFTHVSLKINESSRYSYQRVRKTASVDIPLLSLMIKTEPDKDKFKNTVIGVNNCVQFAQRDKKLEDFLNGQSCDDSIIDEALNNLDEPIYDSRSSVYKKHMFRIATKYAIQDLANQFHKK